MVQRNLYLHNKMTFRLQTQVFNANDKQSSRTFYFLNYNASGQQYVLLKDEKLALPMSYFPSKVHMQQLSRSSEFGVEARFLWIIYQNQGLQGFISINQPMPSLVLWIDIDCASTLQIIHKMCIDELLLLIFN